MFESSSVCIQVPLFSFKNLKLKIIIKQNYLQNVSDWFQTTGMT